MTKMKGLEYFGCYPRITERERDREIGTIRKCRQLTGEIEEASTSTKKKNADEESNKVQMFPR